MTATALQNLPLFQAARLSDAEMSIAAGCRAAKAVRRATVALFELMQDGRARIDEVMWRDLRAERFQFSQGVIRHARLVLSRAEPALLIDTRERRLTSLGSWSRVWIVAPDFRRADDSGGGW